MPDVTIAVETTAPIAWNATPGTIEAALAALPSIGNGANVTVTADGTNRWQVAFVGALAAQNIEPMTIDGGSLGGLAPAPAVTVLQEGSTTPAVNERQRVALGTGTNSGTFTLTYYQFSGKRLEFRQTMEWIRAVLLADTHITNVCADRVYINKVPNVIKTARVPYSIELIHLSNDDLRTMRGIRQYTNNLIGVAVVTPQAQPDLITDLLSQRLSELFDHWGNDNQVVTENGVNVADLLTCRRVRQYSSPENDTTYGEWQHIGVVVEVSLKQIP